MSWLIGGSLLTCPFFLSSICGGGRLWFCCPGATQPVWPACWLNALDKSAFSAAKLVQNLWEVYREVQCRRVLGCPECRSQVWAAQGLSEGWGSCVFWSGDIFGWEAWSLGSPDPERTNLFHRLGVGSTNLPSPERLPVGINVSQGGKHHCHDQQDESWRHCLNQPLGTT